MKKKHRDNLSKLADYLDKLPDDYERFHMREYMAERDGEYWHMIYPDERSKPACGTVACAVGHGPSAGIRVYGDVDWSDYADRVFGEMPENDFTYMFGSLWSQTDNTHKGAAARIRTYVALGHTPDGWSYEDAKVIA